MGCSNSKEHVVQSQDSLLGCCWDRPHTEDDAKVHADWIAYTDNDDGRRPNFAFSLSRDIDVGAEKRNPYLQRYHLAVHKGVICEQEHKVTSETMASSTILQKAERGYGANVAVAGTTVNLAAEVTNIRSMSEGTMTNFTIFVVKCFKLSIQPSRWRECGYTRTPVDTSVWRIQSREQFGEGVITSVIYGGVLIVQHEQENFAPQEKGYSYGANIGASALGGGVVGGHTAKIKTEGAKAINTSVRRIGGPDFDTNVTNKSVEKILEHANAWCQKLLQQPHRAVPISLYLQPYSGIAPHILRLGQDWVDVAGHITAQATEAARVAALKAAADSVAMHGTVCADPDAAAAAAATAAAAELRGRPLDDDDEGSLSTPPLRPFTDSRMLPLEPSSDTAAGAAAAAGGASFDERALPDATRYFSATTDSGRDGGGSAAGVHQPPISAADEAIESERSVMRPGTPPAAAAAAAAAGDDSPSGMPPAQTSTTFQQFSGGSFQDTSSVTHDVIAWELANSECAALRRELDEARAKTEAARRAYEEAVGSLDLIYAAFLPQTPPAEREGMVEYLATMLAQPSDVPEKQLNADWASCAVALFTNPSCAIDDVSIQGHPNPLSGRDACVLAGILSHRHALRRLRALSLAGNVIDEAGAAAVLRAITANASAAGMTEFTLAIGQNDLPEACFAKGATGPFAFARAEAVRSIPKFKLVY